MYIDRVQLLKYDILYILAFDIPPTPYKFLTLNTYFFTKSNSYLISILEILNNRVQTRFFIQDNDFHSQWLFCRPKAGLIGCYFKFLPLKHRNVNISNLKVGCHPPPPSHISCYWPLIRVKIDTKLLRFKDNSLLLYSTFIWSL